jgi:FkbM family methyltransferase
MGLIARMVRQVLPPRWQPPARFLYERSRGLLERELSLAVDAVRPGERVIDVGANVGIYTYAFARRGAIVEAFEPQAQCADVLRAYAAAQPRVRVHQVALGASEGTAALHIPTVGADVDAPQASLKGTGPGRHETVSLARLDSFAFDGVVMIKIDVEGLEAEVLAGAVETIQRDRPLILVEIEQRHHERPASLVFDQLAALRYEGLYLDESRQLQSVAGFDFAARQAGAIDRSAYIFNFLFQPIGGARRWTLR